MNREIFALTMREFFGQRRSLIILLLAVIPVVLAVIFQLGEGDDPQDFTANFLLDGIVIARILPLACLIFGTAALGSEIEDGTIVYILAKPIPRRTIVVTKIAASALLSGAMIVTATIVAGAIGIQGAPGEGLVFGFAIAAAVGAVAYSALFVLLSIATSRALLVGLGYVLIWEGLVSGLFDATAYLSIRHYLLGIADTIATADPDLLDAQLGSEAIILALLAAIGSGYLATTRLETLELSEAE
jgi:ABC-2 type transport system permease protein